jgi:hypothetical protein
MLTDYDVFRFLLLPLPDKREQISLFLSYVGRYLCVCTSVLKKIEEKFYVVVGQTMAVESIPPAVSPVTIVKWTIYTAYDIAE